MSADKATLWLFFYRGLGGLAQRPRDQKLRLRIWAEREELYKSMEIPYLREKITKIQACVSSTAGEKERLSQWGGILDRRNRQRRLRENNMRDSGIDLYEENYLLAFL